MAHLVGDDICYAGLWSFDQFCVENDFSLGCTASPESLRQQMLPVAEALEATSFFGSP